MGRSLVRGMLNRRAWSQMDLGPYLGVTLLAGVALGKATRSQPSHFIWKKKIQIPVLLGCEDVSYKCQVSSTESGTQ